MSHNTHSFSVSLATEIGLEQAILLRHFFSWHESNANREDMVKDGRVWFFTSRVNIRKAFPYLSEQKIKTVIGKLEEGGFILVGNYNVDKFKKTNWYSLTDKSLDLFEESTDRLVKSTNDWLNQPTKEYNNQEYNNINNIEKEVNKKEKAVNSKEMPLPFDSPRLRELWCELMDYPEWKPKTNHAIELRIKKLTRLAEGNLRLAIAIVKQTLEKGWKDFYVLKSEEYYDKEPAPAEPTKELWEKMGFPSKEVYDNYLKQLYEKKR